MKKLSGVYMIQCLINNKKYIGSSADVNQRLYRHRYCLKVNKGPNKLLQDDYNLYGEKFFTFTLIEKIEDVSLLREKEDYYIELLSANKITGGYNIKTATGKYIKTEGGNELVINRTSHKVISINIQTGEVLKHNSIREASEITGIMVTKGSDLIKYWKGYGGKRSCRGYILVDEEDYDSSFDYIGYKRVQRYTARPKKEKIRVLKGRNENSNGDSQKKVILLTNVETGEQVEKRGIKELCREEGFCRGKVFKCLNGQPKQYQHHGYYFEYGHI